jgi:hypothetical protein
MAHWSDGDEERHVDSVVDEELGGLRGGARRQPPRRSDGAHEREVAGSDLADLLGRGELAQPVEREGQVRVPVDAGVIERFASGGARRAFGCPRRRGSPDTRRVLEPEAGHAEVQSFPVLHAGAWS